MRIIRGIDPIRVEHPIFHIVGQPGIGKTSLGYSCADALLFDFDQGAHRAQNRRDTLEINGWADVQDLMADTAALQNYRTLVIDTVGRMIDVMIANLAQVEPKKAPGGNPSLQGWGQIKSNFRTSTGTMRGLGKDILMLSHAKEDKDGDTLIIRPDIAGGSYNEVHKQADFMGYLYAVGKDRILDFNPTDKFTGKNPGRWPPFKIPPIEKATDFMAKLFDMGREALGNLSEESAAVLRDVEVWRDKIAKLEIAQAFNDLMPAIKEIDSPLVHTQVQKLFLDAVKDKGLQYHKQQKKFIHPEPAPAA